MLMITFGFVVCTQCSNVLKWYNTLFMNQMTVKGILNIDVNDDHVDNDSDREREREIYANHR